MSSGDARAGQTALQELPRRGFGALLGAGSRTPVGLREHVLILLAFAATRAVLHAIGLRFHLDLRWMFLSDLDDLRERLLETVYYFHAFAPGMNLITGVLLKISPAHVTELATALFWAFGWLLCACLFQLSRLLGFARGPSAVLALAFSLLPQTLYLENLYLYTFLCAALLCLLAVLFHRALQLRSTSAWLGVFMTCATVGWLYTAFHLVWFVAVALLALLAATSGTRRRVLAALTLPALLLVGLYAKNYALFGVFGATSWGGANLTLTTTQKMHPAERDAWIKAGRLSPYARINVYSPPSAYLRFFPPDLHFPWPGANQLVRPSVNVGNFNHGLFLEVNRQRREDASHFIESRPLDYLRRVVTQNFPALFKSTTHWHPHDRRPDSPHSAHRKVLGGYERLYDRLVHGWPISGVGLYVFLPALYAWGLRRAFTWFRAADDETRAKGAAFGLCLFQIAYVVAVSSLATAGEASRYRYTIEPFIWVMLALAGHASYQRLRGLWPRPGRATTTPETPRVETATFFLPVGSLEHRDRPLPSAPPARAAAVASPTRARS